jgi:hypothetical protein
MDTWKAIAGMLTSILVTGLAAWFSFGAGTATSAELEKQERKIDLNTKSISAVQVSLGRIETKLDILLGDHEN